MKSLLFFCLIFISVGLSSCGVVETIFKAGMWWAFILIALVVGLVIYLATKFRKK